MPLGWVRAFQAMLPRLRARQELRHLGVLQIAWGAGTQSGRDELLSMMRDEADLQVARVPRRGAAAVTELSALGIRVVEE